MLKVEAMVKQVLLPVITALSVKRQHKRVALCGVMREKPGEGIHDGDPSITGTSPKRTLVHNGDIYITVIYP